MPQKLFGTNLVVETKPKKKKENDKASNLCTVLAQSCFIKIVDC